MPKLVDKRDTNGKEDMWSVSKAIAPFGKNDLDDVKLIQTMLILVLTSEGFRKDSPRSERTEIDRIFDNSFGRGVQFSDGIYGANTRAAVGVLERRIGSPVKDGIIRPVFEVDRMGRMSGLSGTKMGDLNDFWDENLITASAASKKESGRKFLAPGVFAKLYPDG
jgi:hypothetical protein